MRSGNSRQLETDPETSAHPSSTYTEDAYDLPRPVGATTMISLPLMASVHTVNCGPRNRSCPQTARVSDGRSFGRPLSSDETID